MAERRQRLQPLATRRPTAKRRHVRLGPGLVDEDQPVRAAGYDDDEILEINQITDYFAYANRTVLGLGCSPGDDILGLSPNQSDDPGNWSHG